MFKELLLQLGYSSITSLIIIIVAKFVIKPIFDSYLSNQVEMNKLDKQLENDKEKLIIQNELDYQAKLNESKLEYETYKKDKVLPKIEKISEIIIQHKMQYNTYINCIMNRGGLPNNFEQQRLELDTNMIESKDKILFYLPKELRDFLNKSRVLISVSWSSPINLSNTFRTFNGIYTKDVCNACSDIYSKRINCFYDLIEEYLKVTYQEKNYLKILNEHGFNEYGDYIEKNVIDEIAMKYIMLHEYYGTNDFVGIDDRISSFVNNNQNP